MSRSRPFSAKNSGVGGTPGGAEVRVLLQSLRNLKYEEFVDKLCVTLFSIPITWGSFVTVCQNGAGPRAVVLSRANPDWFVGHEIVTEPAKGVMLRRGGSASNRATNMSWSPAGDKVKLSNGAFVTLNIPATLQSPALFSATPPCLSATSSL